MLLVHERSQSGGYHYFLRVSDRQVQRFVIPHGRLSQNPVKQIRKQNQAEPYRHSRALPTTILPEERVRLGSIILRVPSVARRRLLDAQTSGSMFQANA
jgi:hypothetical protein